MSIASTYRRVLAHLIDEIIGSLFWIPLLVMIWTQSHSEEVVVVPWLWLCGLWLARIMYEILCIYILEALPAQHFFGLKVVSTHRPDSGVSLGQTTVRVVMDQLRYLLGPAIYFMALFHRERQHLGDILSETCVVQFNERIFEPKVRFILGSILVYTSLVSHLEKNMMVLAAEKITQEGFVVDLPQLFAEEKSIF